MSLRQDHLGGIATVRGVSTVVYCDMRPMVPRVTDGYQDFQDQGSTVPPVNAVKKLNAKTIPIAPFQPRGNAEKHALSRDVVRCLWR